MARRTRIIEGTWNCTSCGSEGVLGRHRVCPSCGNPREDRTESSFDFGETTETGARAKDTVTDTEALASAQAGSDWFCAYCGTANRGDALACRACSAGREPATEAPPPAPLLAAPPARRRRGCLGLSLLSCLGTGGLLFAVLLAVGLWGNRTHEVDGTITSRSWKREITKETFTRVTRSGWRDEIREGRSVMPRRGSGEVAGIERIRDCSRKQKGTRQVATGTERVCSNRTRRAQCGTEEKCHTRDLGNGFAEEVCDDVPKYCDESYEDCGDETTYRTEPVFGEECRYDTWEWRPGPATVVEGANDAPRWPTSNLGRLDREQRKETYSVGITYGKGKMHTLQPKSAEEFAGFPPGRPLRVVVNNFGSVVEVR